MGKLNIKILVGIPGCGKSFYSRNCVLEKPGTKRINRDDLREMFDSGKITDGNENFAKIARMKLIELSLIFNRDVVIDDTNCIKEKLNDLIIDIRKIALNVGKEIIIEVVNFDIDIETCLKRNKNRERVLDDKILYFMQKNKNEINYEELFIDELTIIKNH